MKKLILTAALGLCGAALFGQQQPVVAVASFEAVKSMMRDFANAGIRFNKQMKNEEKLIYGIHPVDRTLTAAGEQGTFPEAEADTSIIRQVTINF